MYKFAWIGYFPEEDTLKKVLNSKGITFSQKDILDNFLDNLTPQEILFLDVESKRGNKTQGSIIIAPLLLKQIPLLSEEKLIEKITSSVKLALRKEARIICLAGVLGRLVSTVKKRINREDIFFITGRKLFTATIIDNLLKISSQLDIDLRKVKLSLFDADSAVARVCCQLLIGKVGEIWLFDKSNRKKDAFAEFSHLNFRNLTISNSIKDVLKGSKLVISTYLFLSEEIIKNLEPKSIFFDAIVPFWSAKTIYNQRKDILPIESAWVTRGPLTHKEFDILFPKDAIVACIAEAVILGLQNSLDGFITEFNSGNVAVVSNLAKKEGFFLADFRCGDTVFGEEIKKIGVSAFR